MKFYIFKNDAGYYWFNIVSRNNRIVATSETYSRKASAIKTCESICGSVLAVGAQIVDKTGEKK